MKVQENEERENRTIKVFLEIMAKNFPKEKKGMNL